MEKRLLSFNDGKFQIAICSPKFCFEVWQLKCDYGGQLWAWLREGGKFVSPIAVFAHLREATQGLQGYRKALPHQVCKALPHLSWARDILIGINIIRTNGSGSVGELVPLLLAIQERRGKCGPSIHSL